MSAKPDPADYDDFTDYELAVALWIDGQGIAIIHEGGLG